MAFILIFICSMSCTIYLPQKNGISKEEALYKANKFLKELDFNLTEYEVNVTEHDKPWNRRIQKDNISSYHTERRKKLEDKVYWSVNYTLKKRETYNKDNITVRYGGGISVFIDEKTGEILTTYFE